MKKLFAVVVKYIFCYSFDSSGGSYAKSASYRYSLGIPTLSVSFFCKHMASDNPKCFPFEPLRGVAHQSVNLRFVSSARPKIQHVRSFEGTFCELQQCAFSSILTGY